MSDELLRQFVVEGRELAQAAAEALLALEAGREDWDRAGVARALHTLKGSTGLFDLAELGMLLHAAEDRLPAAATLRADPTLAADLLDVTAEVERWLDRLEAAGAPEPADRARARALAERLGGAAASPSEARGAGEVPDWAAVLAGELAPGEDALAVRYAPDVQAYFRGEDPLALMQALPGLRRLQVARRPDRPSGAAYQTFECDLVLTALAETPLDAAAQVFRLAPDQVELVPLRGAAPEIASPIPTPLPARLARESAPGTEAPRAAASLRIAPARIDEVAALLDEAIIAKNALAEAVAALGSLPPAVADRQGGLERALAALYGAVGELRLAPLGPVFDRFARQARALSAQLGKPVEVVTGGGELAIDKDVVEGLHEPLLHLLRNALDHGIEPTEARRAHGKPARARLKLTAHAAGDRAVVEFSDDGRGFDLARIREVATARGLLEADAAARLDPAETLELVFAPGFSTARAVTDVSGRGVGLDAVRAAVGRLGGRIELETRPGAGSTARLLLPLRTAMARLAVVQAGGRRFGAPLAAVREVVRLPREQVAPMRAAAAFELRDEVLPLLDLNSLLGFAPCRCDPLTVMVVGEAPHAVGLAVEGLAERIEAPVRRASGLLAGLRGVEGTVVEGDGRVLMVLDLEAMTA